MTETSKSAGPRVRNLQVAFAVFCVIGLIWAVAEWRGWIGGAPLDRPVSPVFLMSFLTTMAVGWIAQRRWPRLANVLLALAIAAYVLLMASIMAG